MALKELIVKFNSDTSGFDQGLKHVKSGLSGLRGAASKTTSGLSNMASGFKSALKSGLALGGIAVGLKGLADSTKTFTGLESSMQRTSDLFSESSKYISYFAQNTGKAFGMAETSAYQYSAVYGNLFKNITSGAAENSKVTIAMLKASGVVASKTGRTMEDVMERIRSGLLGNTEAIEDLGINVNVAMLEVTDAFKRIANGRSWEQLTFYEQQQIRTLAILEQAHKNYGDSVQKGSAYNLAVFSGALKDMMAAAGQFVNAGLQPIIKGLTKIIQYATAGMKALAGMMGLKIDTGDTTENTDAQTESQNVLTDAIKDTTKARQKLVGVDEINTLSNDKETSSGTTAEASTGASSSIFSDIAMPEYKIEEPDISWMDGFKSKFNDFKAQFDFSGIQQSWANLKTALTPLGENIGSGLKWLWDTILVPFSTWTVNSLIPAFLNTLASAIDTVNSVITALAPLGQWLWDSFLAPFVSWTGGVVVDVLTSLTGALTQISDWISANQELVQGMPFTSNRRDDPSIQAGDFIEHTGVNGKTYRTVITKYTYKFGGQCQMAAVGASKAAAGYKSTLNRKVSQLKRKIYEKQIQLDELDQAILNATKLIAGALGGYWIQGTGQYEGNVFVADNPDITQAMKVWRWNLGGFGYSENGVNGPYSTAITADGSIIASTLMARIIVGDMIKAGTIKAEHLEAQTITGDKIAAKAITGSKIAGETITGDNILANSISGEKLKAGTVEASKLTTPGVTDFYGTIGQPSDPNSGRAFNIYRSANTRLSSQWYSVQGGLVQDYHANSAAIRLLSDSSGVPTCEIYLTPNGPVFYKDNQLIGTSGKIAISTLQESNILIS